MLLLLAGLLVAAAAAARQKTLLVLGDSLSAAYNIDAAAGWVRLLDQRLQERYPGWQVVNASISGETSAGGLARLPDLLERHRPEILILALGANDGLRGLPTAQLEQNLARMVGLVRASGGRVLLAGMRIPDNYGRIYQQRFASVYPRLAERENVALAPFLLRGVATEPEYMLADGLHPNAAAQPLILDNIWLSLEPLLNAASQSAVSGKADPVP